MSFFGLFRIRRDLKPTVKKMSLWGIFREERLWRHSYAQDATSEAESLGLYEVLCSDLNFQDATSEAESLGLYKVLRAEVVIR